MTDLWPRLEPLLASAERPARYLNHEFGCVYKPEADFRFCMMYPDTYELGQANQALRILVNVVNAVDGMVAERAFLPAAEFCDTMRAEGLPLFSIESCAPVAEFDAIGITLSHELVATNVLEALDLAGIPLHAQDRGEDDLFVIGGGPCSYNPEPYAPFFDIFNIGEGEEALPECLQAIRRLRAEGACRADILRAIARMDGYYVPSLYRWRDEEQAQQAGSWIEPVEEGLPTRIQKRVFEGFAESPGWEACIVPFTEVVQDRLNVEVLRGCARGCRFCQAGITYRPVRERTPDQIVAAVSRGLAHTGYDEVSLTSLSTTDHSCCSQILSRLNRGLEGTGVSVSIPSQRLDAFGVDMALEVAGEKKGGLTFAPEAGSQRLRDVINKNVTEDDLERATRAAFEAGWRRVKLYFMMGLPGETDDDIRAIAELADRTYELAREVVPKGQRGGISVSVSVSVFIPKAATPFQWCAQTPDEEVKRRQQLLIHSVRNRAVRVHYHDADTSLIEAVLSRGGRDLSGVIMGAWRRGARFDAWTEQFDLARWEDAAREEGIDLRAVAQTPFELEARLPWEHVSPGVSRGFLLREWRRAMNAETTPDCTRTSCTGCGICPTLH
uniref:TIGR03960 family B12-binding radical SAM protein n=1 Tax=Senegalimassilia anaerobia TaxID=1473216 RepID=UPI003A8D147E